MGQIFRFADHARRRGTPGPSPPPLGESAFYCKRCEADRFLLYPSGEVQCASCGAQIENLAVGEAAYGEPDPKV
jgi:hypothetical protein